jgi:enamine deaminase RidA (YjgF/YER057c/UK114 family)
MSDVRPLQARVDGPFIRFSTETTWELTMGYSRAVRCGRFIYVTGTVGIELDGTYPPGLAAQTARALRIIHSALQAAGADWRDVVRTRIYTTDIAQWQEIASVHGSIFREIRPCTTLVGVAQLIDPQALVEIEVDAILPELPPGP